jgi:hypothetical protein
MRDRLRALPQLEPPHGLWRAVAVDAVGKPPPGRTPLAGCWSASRPVSLLGMAADPEHDAAARRGAGAGETTDLIAATPAPASSVNGVSRAELLETSRQLEAALRAMPAAPQVTRASTALTIAELQDRMFEVDYSLSEPGLIPPANGRSGSSACG